MSDIIELLHSIIRRLENGSYDFINLEKTLGTRKVTDGIVQWEKYNGFVTYTLVVAEAERKNEKK